MRNRLNKPIGELRSSFVCINHTRAIRGMGQEREALEATLYRAIEKSTPKDMNYLGRYFSMRMPDSPRAKAARYF